MITSGCDVHTADHSLELDERMSFVVKVRRASLATGTEVCIVTYGTLVAVSNDVRRLVAAKRSITVDAVVSSLAKVSSTGVANWFIDWNEAMSRVDKTGVDNACRAVVPVRAVKAFVTDTEDVLVTTIANSMVTRIAAWLKKSLGKRI